ncbi:MAG: protein-disulfide reductase DsbD [Telluria sp.]
MTTHAAADQRSAGSRLAAWIARVLLAPLAIMAMLFPATGMAASDYLDPEQAFRFSARMVDQATVEVRYEIAPGYYMYREKFAFKAGGAQLQSPAFPPGKIKYDETFAKDVESYRNSVTIRIPVQASAAFTLESTAQGCADAGLCYSPMTSTARLDPADAPAASAAATGAAPPATAAPDSEMGRIEAALHGGKLLAIMPLFLLLGLGLAFTPCVLPMMPILSSIIVGERESGSRGRGLALSASYSLGMAIVCTMLGVAAGLAGEGLAAALQNPWVLGAFALLMAALSLSMFGVYELQMPAAIQSKLVSASGKQRSGSHAGVFVMGALSALIVGPCVAAPLAGALVYISQTRDALTGAAALFAMAAGMSVPLLVMGASAGALLPRAGAWMEAIKRFFGVLMLATALWIVSPVLAPKVQMLLWAALAIGYALSLVLPLARLQRSRWRSSTVAVVFAGLGLVQLAGVATGGNDPFAPLAHLGGGAAHATEFRRVKSVAELDAILAAAPGKTVMLDFYADWCVSCKEMEKFTFSDPRVQAEFAGMLLLQADVTANDEHDKAMLKRFGLFGPPGIIFFDPAGAEIADTRVIGYQDADKFLGSLAATRSR